jgi:hypothetical protein
VGVASRCPLGTEWAEAKDGCSRWDIGHPALCSWSQASDPALADLALSAER